MNRDNKPEIINGAAHKDQRGSISFVNDFTFDGVKRFYVIQQADLNIARAWQGHRQEQKWLYVVAGNFKVVTVKIDNWENPSDHCEVTEFGLSSYSPGVLYIPGGYANGFKAIEPNSRIIIFSDFTLQQSAGDNYRFDQNRWFDWDQLRK